MGGLLGTELRVARARVEDLQVPWGRRRKPDRLTPPDHDPRAPEQRDEPATRRSRKPHHMV